MGCEERKEKQTGSEDFQLVNPRSAGSLDFTPPAGGGGGGV